MYHAGLVGLRVCIILVFLFFVSDMGWEGLWDGGAGAWEVTGYTTYTHGWADVRMDYGSDTGCRLEAWEGLCTKVTTW